MKSFQLPNLKGCRKRFSEIVDCLLPFIDRNADDSLIIAFREGYLAITEKLWNSQKIYFDARESPLVLAALEGHLEIFHLIFLFYSEQSQCKVSLLRTQKLVFGTYAFDSSK
jgi:hypothetical protein